MKPGDVAPQHVVSLVEAFDRVAEGYGADDVISAAGSMMVLGLCRTHESLDEAMEAARQASWVLFRSMLHNHPIVRDRMESGEELKFKGATPQ